MLSASRCQHRGDSFGGNLEALRTYGACLTGHACCRRAPSAHTRMRGPQAIQVHNLILYEPHTLSPHAHSKTWKPTKRKRKHESHILSLLQSRRLSNRHHTPSLRIVLTLSLHRLAIHHFFFSLLLLLPLGGGGGIRALCTIRSLSRTVLLFDPAKARLALGHVRLPRGFLDHTTVLILNRAFSATEFLLIPKLAERVERGRDGSDRKSWRG